jgi:hypothetical protein
VTEAERFNKKLKLDPKVHRGMMLGMAANGRGWLVFDLDTTTKLQIYVTRDVEFNETSFTHRGHLLMKALGVEDGYVEEERETDEILDECVQQVEEQELGRALKDIKAMEAQAAKEKEKQAAAQAKEVEQKEASSEEVNHNVPLDASAPMSSVSSVHVPEVPSVIPKPKVIKGPKSNNNVPASTRALRTSTMNLRNAYLMTPGTVASSQEVNHYQDEKKQKENKINLEVDPTIPLPVSDPLTYEEAINGPNASEWYQAMDEEMSSHAKNNTWLLTPLPPDRLTSPMGCKWVYKTKYGPTGKLIRRKARLCAQGFTQVHGIDYHETFAPVLMYKVLRLILTLAAVWNYELKQMDVETAFLNAEMKEEVYMKQPKGYEVDAVNDASSGTGSGPLVCRLKKTLYGLKQASKDWNEEINSLIVMSDPMGMAYERCQTDPCLYWKRSRTGHLMLLGLFVDDIISSYHPMDELEWLENKLKLMNKYAMKDLGDLEWALGMKVTRDRSNLHLTLDQGQHVKEVLKSFGMHECIRRDVPEQVGIKLMLNDESGLAEAGGEPEMIQEEPGELKYARKKLYESIVGKLHYVSQSTRPDISHAVNQLSRFQQNPSAAHLEAGWYVLRYLKGTPSLPIEFRPNTTEMNQQKGKHEDQVSDALVTAYTDADWGGDLNDRKSTTGFVVQVYGCTISWQSKKQATVALSTAEAEYMAISMVLQEVKWLHQLLQELGLRINAKDRTTEVHTESSSSSSNVSPTIIYTDNRAARSLCESEGNPHSRTKHIDIRHHFIRESIKSREVQLAWIESSEQVADILTKALDKQTYQHLRRKLLRTSESTIQAGLELEPNSF